MAIKYATQEADGSVALHHNVADEEIPLPPDSVKLADSEYESIALGQATLVKGKVKPL
jgi:hypothetical protein